MRKLRFYIPLLPAIPVILDGYFRILGFEGILPEVGAGVATIRAVVGLLATIASVATTTAIINGDLK